MQHVSCNKNEKQINETTLEIEILIKIWVKRLPRIKKELMRELINKTKLSPRSVYRIIEKFRSNSLVPISLDEATYLLAWNKGIDIYKFIKDENTINRLRNLQGQIVVGRPVEILKKQKTLPIKRKELKKVVIEKYLKNLELDQELLKDCFPLRKPYRHQVKDAYLTLETRIRKILALSDSYTGIDLIQKADEFGVFNRKVTSEKQGLNMLFRGAVMWLRNPPGHRKIEYEMNEAIKLILFADYLIKLFQELIISQFVESLSFDDTIRVTTLIYNFREYLLKNQIIRMAEATASNSQIYGSFAIDKIKIIFLDKRDFLDKELIAKLAKENIKI